MSTNKVICRDHNYHQITAKKFFSKSSDALTNIDLKIECQEKQKQTNKTLKMKKSQTAIITDLNTKPQQSSFNSTSLLRRRFSLFRIKRSQQSNENSNIQMLQQTIEQLKRDLLVVGTSNNIIAYDIDRNVDLFFKEVCI